MRQHFNTEMHEINQEILRMGVLVEENINKALQALINQDPKLAQDVIAGDKLVNDLEMSITDRLTILLALQNPVASDLRHVIACLKAVSDIERIGDFAVHVAKRARDLADEKYIKPLIDIPKMLHIGAEMLRGSLQALMDADEHSARQIAKMDQEMDSLNKQVYRELLTYMLEDSKNIKQATKFLNLSRVLERMGDHAVHICSWAVYSATGKHEEL